MRRFRIKTGADVSDLDGHEIGGVYELHRFDSNGDTWLKTDNEFGAWCYLASDIEEVFDNDGGTTLTQHKPLHKDTDLGYFAGLFVASFSGNLDSDDKFIHFAKMAGMKHNESGKEAVVRQSISLARELIKQLDEQGHEQ